MQLLDDNNLAHCDDITNGVRKIVLIFSTQVFASGQEEEEQVEDRVVKAYGNLIQAMQDKLDCIIADIEVNR